MDDDLHPDNKIFLWFQMQHVNISKNNEQLASIRYFVIIPHTPRFDLNYRTYYPGTVQNRKGMAEILHFNEMGEIKINGSGGN